MNSREGRLSRWSRLKQAGGALNEEQHNQEPKEEIKSGSLTEVEKHQSTNNSKSIDRVRKAGNAETQKTTAPVMPPLAGYEVGETGLEAPPPEAIRLMEAQKSQTEQTKDMSLLEGDSEERELTEEEKTIVSELPPLESLTKDSDFTPFLMDKVPGFIRRRALNLLWRNNPIFAHLDGLNDYDEDFNVIDKLIDAATDSNYKVGRGMNADEDKPEQPAEEKFERVAAQNSEGNEFDDGENVDTLESGVSNEKKTDDKKLNIAQKQKRTDKKLVMEEKDPVDSKTSASGSVDTDQTAKLTET